MKTRYVYFVAFSSERAGQFGTMNLEMFTARPANRLTDVNGWFKTDLINGLAEAYPHWDRSIGGWRNTLVILGCSLLSTEVQQPNGDWVAA